MSRLSEERVVTLDALRALGALLVLVSHVGFWSGATRDGVVGGLMARGDAGVALFFALSAYLLGRPLVARVVDDSAPPWSARRYGAHRLVRILPAYYLALAAVVTAATVIGGAAAAALTPRDLLVHAVIGQGYTGRTFSSFTQTWSLTTEVSFYVALPLALMALRRGLRGRERVTRARCLLVVWTAAAAVGVLAQLVAAASASGRGPLPTAWAGVLATSIVGHAAWFAVGLAVATLQVVPESRPRWCGAAAWEAARTSPGTAALTAALVYLVVSTPLGGPRDLALPTVGAAVAKELLYACFSALCLGVALSRGVNGFLSRSALGGVARAAGDLSYGVFLWHVLVLQVVFTALGLTLFATGVGWLVVLVGTTSVMVAALSWRLVERPLLRRLHPRSELLGPEGAPGPGPR